MKVMLGCKMSVKCVYENQEYYDIFLKTDINVPQQIIEKVKCLHVECAVWRGLCHH